MPWRQIDLEAALRRLQMGEISFHSASRMYGVPYSTLRDKFHGRTPLVARRGPNPFLTMAEEDRIVKWAIEMSRIGFGQTKSDIQNVVKRFLDKEGRPSCFKSNMPGDKWWRGFRARHPKLVYRRPQPMGKERAIVSSHRIDKWFKDFELYLQEERALSIMHDPRRIFNADESGFALGGRLRDRVLAEKGEKRVPEFKNSEKTQVTVLATVSAAGDYLPPMIILPGQQHRDGNSYQGAPKGTFFSRTKNGWQDTRSFFSYVANVFHPFILQKKVPLPVLLFVDGLSCHQSLEVARFCREKQIILYRFPAHATHIVQPLDLTVFRSLKSEWHHAERAYRFRYPGDYVTKSTFARVFSEAWGKVVRRPEVAKSGFRVAGLFPFTGRYDSKMVRPATVFSFEASKRGHEEQCPLPDPNTAATPSERAGFPHGSTPRPCGRPRQSPRPSQASPIPSTSRASQFRPPPPASPSLPPSHAIRMTPRASRFRPPPPASPSLSPSHAIPSTSRASRFRPPPPASPSLPPSHAIRMTPRASRFRPPPPASPSLPPSHAIPSTSRASQFRPPPPASPSPPPSPASRFQPPLPASPSPSPSPASRFRPPSPASPSPPPSPASHFQPPSPASPSPPASPASRFRAPSPASPSPPPSPVSRFRPPSPASPSPSTSPASRFRPPSPASPSPPASPASRFRPPSPASPSPPPSPASRFRPPSPASPSPPPSPASRFRPPSPASPSPPPPLLLSALQLSMTPQITRAAQSLPGLTEPLLNPDFVSPSLEEYITYPAINVPQNRRRKLQLPEVISGEEFFRYITNKRKKEKEEEEMRKTNREARLNKRIQKEQEQHEKKKQIEERRKQAKEKSMKKVEEKRKRMEEMITRKRNNERKKEERMTKSKKRRTQTEDEMPAENRDQTRDMEETEERGQVVQKEGSLNQNKGRNSERKKLKEMKKKMKKIKQKTLKKSLKKRKEQKKEEKKRKQQNRRYKQQKNENVHIKAKGKDKVEELKEGQEKIKEGRENVVKKGGKANKKTERLTDEELYTCPGCLRTGNFDDKWVQCDHCDTWIHLECTILRRLRMKYIAEVDFKCKFC